MLNLQIPSGCWMHKNRSEKTDKGMFSFRGIGGGWNRRWVQIDVKTMSIAYGKSSSNLDKKIPLQLITAADATISQKIKAAGGPSVHAENGFVLVTEEKEYLWCTERAEDRDSWVDYFVKALEIMKGAGPVTRSRFSPDDELIDDDDEPDENTLDGMIAAAESRARFEQDRPTSTATTGGGGDDDEDGDGPTGEKSQRELHRLVAGDDDGQDFDLDGLEDFDDDFDSEEDDEDEDDGEGGGSPTVNRDLIYQTFLTKKSKEVYDHIAYKFATYKDSFKKDETIHFSRTVEKLGKKDNVQQRDVFVTNKHLYLCHKGMLGSASVRVIEIHQLVGVIESSFDNALFAIIIPSYHDILIRITAQKSVIEGNEVDVKHQMIAHLHAAQRAAVSDRPFVFRTVADVRSVIRRSEDDSHLPMTTKGIYQDHLRCADKKKIYTAFRTLADSIVYYSVKVFRVNFERQQQLSSLVITDSACYVCNDNCEKVRRRVPLTSIRKVLYDSDTFAVLIQCQDMDEVLTVKSEADFKNLKSVVPYVCRDSMSLEVKCAASHQLYSVAQLIDKRSLMDKMGTQFSNTEDGLKLAGKFTRRLMMRGMANFAAGMKTVGSKMVDAGGTVVDGMKDGLGTVGTAMADNAVTGSMMSVMGAAGGNKLFGQQRLLFEQCLELEEEAKYTKAAKDHGKADALNLQGLPNLANWRLGTIYYSSRCHLFNVQSTLDSEKTQEKLLVLCDKGLYFFDDPNAGKKSLGNVFRSAKSFYSDKNLSFQQILGVIRCEREQNVVAIQCGEGASSDMMFRIPNIGLADKFVAHLSICYQLEMTEKLEGVRCYLPKLMSSKPDSLRGALKRSQLDPDATLALRSHVMSDQLSMSIIPDICDTLRRHGDNKIFFSGLAWRYRDQKKKPGETMPTPPLNTAELKKNKDYKSFVLLITNCALYMMTKGGYEITRRTELRSFSKVYMSSDDPDALLLEVPDEGYDIFMKVEGRAKEFIERLQDARSHWTDYNLYLSNEDEGSHDIEKFTFPIVTAPAIHLLGKQEKPRGFDEIQGKREANAIKVNYVKEMIKTIEAALAFSTEVDDGTGLGGFGALARNRSGTVLSGAFGRGRRAHHNSETDSMSDRASMARTAMTEYDTWENELKRNEDRIHTILFAVQRAYRFGFRPHNVKNMTQALTEVEDFNRRKEFAEKLTSALNREDIALYDSIWEKCRHLKGMDLFQRRQRDVLNKLRTRQAIEAKIIRSIEASDEEFAEENKPEEEEEEVNLDFDAEENDDDNKANTQSSPPAGSQAFGSLCMSLEDRLPTIEKLFVDAHAAGVKSDRLHEFRSMLNRRLQQERLRDYVQSIARHPAKASQLNPQQKELLRQAAAKLDVPIRGESMIDRGSPMLVWATRVLGAAADSGNAKTMQDALARVKASEVASDADVIALMKQVEQELQVLSASDDLIENLTTLIAQLKASIHGLPVEELIRYKIELQQIAEKTKDSRGLKQRHALASMYVRRVSEAIELRELERQRTEREQKEREEYFQRIEQAEAVQKKALEEAQKKEEEEQRRRREEQLMLWTDKATKHRLLLDQYLRSGDVQSARMTSSSCTNLSAELKGMFANYNENEQAEHGTRVQQICDSLNETARRAAQWVQNKTGSSSASRAVEAATSGDGAGGADSNGGSTMELPEEVKDDIRRLDKVKLVAFVQAHQGSLSIQLVEQIRLLWRTAAAEGKWVANLHTSIHTAVALGSVDMLQRALDNAKAHHQYSDRVVRDGRNLLERMKRDAANAKEGEDDGSTGQDNNSKGKDSADASATEGGNKNMFQSIPQPPPPPVPNIANHGGPRGDAIKQLHQAICELFADREGATYGKKDAKKVRLPEDARSIRLVIDAWIRVLTHRVRPTGVFTKTDRNLKDVMQVVSNSFHQGVQLAPETNRLYNTFERIKKFNNPKGLNTHQMFLRYVLLKGRLSAILQEMTNATAKDLENLFFEDSLHRHHDECSIELQKLSELMCGAVEWSFEISEGDEILGGGDSASNSLSSSVAGSPNPSMTNRGGVGGGDNSSIVSSRAGSPAANSGHPTFGNNRGNDNPIPQLRRSVTALTDYFRRESSKSSGFSPQELKLIFDEGKNKTVGLLVRENLCLALNHIFLSGFKGGGTVFKKHPWEFLAATGEKLKVGTRGLGGVGIPDTIEMILGLTNTDSSSRRGRGQQNELAKLSSDQLNNIRMRMFFAHCLNQQTLQRSIEAIFDDQDHNSQFMMKYYDLSKCAMLDANMRKEILRVIHKLSALPFTLSVDAEIW